MLKRLAVVALEWLKEPWQEVWIERDEHRVEDARLPDGKPAREASAILMGHDGATVLGALSSEAAPPWLREVPALHTLRCVWVQHVSGEEGALRRRDLSNAPAAGAWISAPSDPHALFAHTRETRWVGSNVPLTETGDDDVPHLITHVETSPAPHADEEALPPRPAVLALHDVLPQKPVGETGSVDTQERVHRRQDDDVDLCGPPREESHGHAREHSGCAASHVDID